MKNNIRGYSSLELAIVVAIVAIFAIIVASVGHDIIFNRPGQTEARASKNMESWIASNGMTGVSRKSCAHDSDGDGYGSCTVVTAQGEKIYLDCVARWWPELTGATGCKEIEMNLKMIGASPITNKIQNNSFK